MPFNGCHVSYKLTWRGNQRGGTGASGYNNLRRINERLEFVTVCYGYTLPVAHCLVVPPLEHRRKIHASATEYREISLVDEFSLVRIVLTCLKL